MQPANPATLTEPFFFRIANAVWGLSQRYWKLIVVAMLALLHVAVFRGVADPWARALVLLLRLDWWLLAFWVIVLAGLVGGKVYQHHARWQRRCYLVVLAYLLALLAIAILPEIAPRREIAPEIRTAAEYVLPFAFVLIALFPGEAETVEAAQVMDFFYSVFLMLVLVV